MAEIGYIRSAYDSCVYHQRLTDDSHIYLLFYVDDMSIAAKTMSDIKGLKEQLKREFEMKDLGVVKRILGMEIQRDRPAGILYLSQKKYIERTIVTLSTTKAEYIAATEAVKEAIWFKGLVGDLGLKQESSTVYSAVKNVVSQGTVMIEKIFTVENPTDMMTKHIPEITFKPTVKREEPFFERVC
ncbi:hypothetical protein RJ639_032425 [Escallonia herrerae]|uniref:Reverse transcriptase Ty1/copia-type domain-containing protein n=1 Tax=Escallonia herrerae TaxID=1293975 RepID=A0AA88WU58_9ASTE|nr:hypothetical protein RJ639_032425 [Escallonia herrerae]